MRLFVLLAVLLWSSCASAERPATVAVAFDRNAIRAVIVEGLADRQTRRPVTADSPVRIASISKLVTALGVMRLVDQGVLDLDRDVSEYLGWRLRNPAFPDRAITLRLLLSHQASLVDGPDLYVIPLGQTLRGRLADPRVWDEVHAPASGWFQYANINFPVVASVMEAATGERFDLLMQRLVFQPLRLDACLNWSRCSPRALRRATVLYNPDGSAARDDLKGVTPACLVVPAADGSCDLSTYRPGENGSLFSPQGGVRISMRDLAKVGMILARRARGFLSERSYAELLGPEWMLSGDNGRDEQGKQSGLFCSYGLAVHALGTKRPGCRDDLFGDGRLRLGHSGEAYGLRSGLWVDPATGRGIAFFTTRVPEDEPTGASAFTQREEAVVMRVLRQETVSRMVR